MEGLPQLRLKILGSGPELPNLQRIIKELNLNNVDFLGHVEGNEKWKLWKNALATVIPSVCYETFSLVTLESMALGIPIIASDLGSLPFVVEDKKTGALFKYADHHDLREKLESLISDKYEWAAMGRAGRVTLEERYTPDAHHDQLMKIYQETLAKPPR
jgi:glycosyltransferase involved in cell wall biosynthesis